jgi:CheY-like chemotaxis protein
MGDSGKRYWVLIVEDDPQQVLLIRAVFAHFDANAHISVVNSAEAAIVQIAGPWAPWTDTKAGRAELPDVIVLDIEMAGMGGLGFLRWYSGDLQLAHVPVVVFTFSRDPELERLCYSLGAREFKVKSADYRELVPVVPGVLDRWQPQERQSGA